MNTNLLTRKATVARAGERGFTLIEIMIVVVIIGLLAGLVAVNLLPKAEEAKRTTAKTQMKMIESALDLYKLDTGKYPSTEDGLEILANPPEGQPYLKGGQVPKDPWGNPYQYISPGEGNKPYEIISYGPDGQPGGSGEDADISNWSSDEDES